MIPRRAGRIVTNLDELGRGKLVKGVDQLTHSDFVIRVRATGMTRRRSSFSISSESRR